MEVKAPNGDVYDLPESVATGLAQGEGWSLVVPEVEKPAARRTRKSD